MFRNRRKHVNEINPARGHRGQRSNIVDLRQWKTVQQTNRTAEVACTTVQSVPVGQYRQDSMHAVRRVSVHEL